MLTDDLSWLDFTFFEGLVYGNSGTENLDVSFSQTILLEWTVVNKPGQRPLEKFRTECALHCQPCKYNTVGRSHRPYTPTAEA